MNEKREYGILWSESLLAFAKCVWGFATIVAVFAAVAWLAYVMSEGHANAAAFFGTLYGGAAGAGFVGMLRVGDIRRMNENSK